LKRVAIGRKNWLFAGNDRAGQTAAILYSLIAVDPQRYLTRVLAKVAATPTGELEQFLPDVWKRQDAADRGLN
jgi:transposase